MPLASGFSRQVSQRFSPSGPSEKRAAQGPARRETPRNSKSRPQGTAPCTVPTHVPHSSLLFRGLDFEFQLPGGELAESGVDLDPRRRGISEHSLVLNAQLPRSAVVDDASIVGPTCYRIICQSGVPLIQFDFFPWGNGHGGRGVRFPRSSEASDGVARLARAVCHGRQGLLEERGDVLERDLFLADVANPDDECDRFAVTVGPLLACGEAQARLQAVDLLAPRGEGLLLLCRSTGFFSSASFTSSSSFPVASLLERGIKLDTLLRGVSKYWIVLELERPCSVEHRGPVRHVLTCRLRTRASIREVRSPFQLPKFTSTGR